MIRPGRFDPVIGVGVPERAAREQTLRRCLQAIGEFDLHNVADLTDGATVADLREIVRRAVLEHGASLTSSDLIAVVRNGRWKPKVPTGQYL